MSEPYEPWTGAMIQMLRIMIDDNAYQGTYTYTDSRLRELLVMASMYVTQEITFSNTYTIDMIATSISPDPYTLNDKVFMNMVVMKAACILDQSYLRQRAFVANLEARCGPAVMKTNGHLDGFKTLLELGPCGIYEKLKIEQQFGGESLNNLIHFVLSPFVGNDFDPQGAFRDYGDSERMFR